jgi:hypothetical protein
MEKNMEQIVDVIEYENCSVRLRVDCILQIDGHPNSVTTLTDAVEYLKIQKKLAKGIKRPLLVNIGNIKSMDRDARIYLGSDVAGENINSVALVISSHLGRIIGNFFLGLNKTKYPTRLFTSTAEADIWLREFL